MKVVLNWLYFICIDLKKIDFKPICVKLIIVKICIISDIILQQKFQIINIAEAIWKVTVQFDYH